MTTRSSTIWADVTSRATPDTGAMSPKPTVASTVIVKYTLAARSRGWVKLVASDIDRVRYE